MDKTSIGDRMKKYEHVTRSYLSPRTPTIIRVDGKAFHTWTRRNLDLQVSPFNITMHNTMSATTRHLVNRIQNAVLAYSQSDEISILLNDWKNLNTEQWFNGNIQKIASVSAALATAVFNESFQYNETEESKINNLALFDSRVFQLPLNEVANYFIWRQQDATRNSINMLGRHYFSHKHLHGKNTSQVQDMLMHNHQINWNDLFPWKKRGFCVLKTSDVGTYDGQIPIFTADRSYIEQHLGENNDG